MSRLPPTAAPRGQLNPVTTPETVGRPRVDRGGHQQQGLHQLPRCSAGDHGRLQHRRRSGLHAVRDRRSTANHAFQVSENSIGNLAIDPELAHHLPDVLGDHDRCGDGVRAATRRRRRDAATTTASTWRSRPTADCTFTDYPVYINLGSDSRLRAPVRERLGRSGQGTCTRSIRTTTTSTTRSRPTTVRRGAGRT